MATTRDLDTVFPDVPGGLPAASAVVHYDEPPVKPPPLLAVGPLAWMRENLFRSPFDAALTLVSIAILVSLIVGIIGWAIGQANWLVVNRNMRLFMLGTYPPSEAWRLGLATLIAAFAVGFTLYAYTRLKWRGLTVIALALAVLWAAPFVIAAATQPLAMLMAAGETPIASGTVTETPVSNLGFIGRAGETVRITWADMAAPPASDAAAARADEARIAADEARIAADDARIAAADGFAERAAQSLVTGARAALATRETLAVLQAERETALLTDAQRAALESEIAGVQLAPFPSETYALNTAPVALDLIDGASGDVLASIVLAPPPALAAARAEAEAAGSEPPPDALTATLPADGWYIVRKTVQGEGAALLAATGVYPLVERDLGGGTANYARVTDDFETAAVRPEIDGRDVPAAFLVDHQYLGTRSFNDYLRLSLGPFLDLLARGLVPFGLLAVVGYAAGFGLTRVNVAGLRRAGASAAAVARARGHAAARDLTPALWAAALFVLFILSAGGDGYGAGDLGLLLARFAWVGFMFFAGALVTQAYGPPLVGLGLVLGAALTLLADGVFTRPTLGGVVGVVVWVLIGVYAARAGASRTERITPRDAVFGVLGSAALGVFALVATAALLGGRGELLPPVDTRRWGGFLLTLILTVVAILASFPLGILLALGRRSDLPAVKWACTIYIELVRGVPLITVLFMAQLLVPLVGAGLNEVDNVVRAIVGLTLFSAAYLAENVRGGLQSIPPGQEEASKALGLQGWQTTLFILLPQALRAVIPALVGQCIALFKDTSLVALVGLTDLTGIARAAIAQTEFIGLQTEVYVFISVIYFIFSYLMAYISRRIEASGSGAARRV
jgi:His/Glu/Gln/Arg/opine family amino acid ABC transporter permease subunit